MAKAEDLAEAFEIFSKYTDDKYILDADYEEIKVHVNPENVDSEDKEILDSIGFYAKTESRYEPHFYYFT